MRLCEFDSSSSAGPAVEIDSDDIERLTGLAELLAGQSIDAGADPSISLRAFTQYAKNLNINNITDRAIIDASQKPPLNNVIKNIEKSNDYDDQVVYFYGSEEKPDSNEKTSSAAGEASDSKAIVNQMASRQASKALK